MIGSLIDDLKTDLSLTLMVLAMGVTTIRRKETFNKKCNS